jgi:L-lactate utilization protein LutC
MSDRLAFLNRVSEAVRQGGHAGMTPPYPERNGVGYQGGGDDPVQRFSEMLAVAGGKFCRAAKSELVVSSVLGHIQRLNARRILLGCEPLLQRLEVASVLREQACEVTLASELLAPDGRDRFFAADIAVTGVDFLIADTGSIVMLARPEQPRFASLLPPVHVAIAERGQLLPDLFDLFDRIDPKLAASCISLITGPSKTGDIELKLVTGVHGPGEVHVVLLD